MKKKPKRHNKRNKEQLVNSSSGASSLEQAVKQALAASSIDEIPEDGYNPETCEYWIGGEVHHEMDTIWTKATDILASEQADYLLANLDDELMKPIFVDDYLLKLKIKDFRKELSSEERADIEQHGYKTDWFESISETELAWTLAMEEAKKQDCIGYATVCLMGNFYVIADYFHNPVANEDDILIVPLNAEPCLPYHHACELGIVADIGNMNFSTFLKYKKGAALDWTKRFSQELSFRRKFQPNYNPYDDPYDNAGIEAIDGDGDVE